MTDTIAAGLAASAVEIGGLDPPMDRAELLVAMAHHTRDRTVWGGDRALAYWDRLPDKVRMATYAGPALASWWERCCSVLGCTQPRRAEDRTALATALSSGDDRAVLDALRTRAELLCLRVRLAVQMTRDRTTGQQTERQEELA